MKFKHLFNMSHSLGLAVALTFLTAHSESVAQPAPNEAPTQEGSEAGDRAWQEVLHSIQPPEVPAEWRTRQPGQEELETFRKKNAASASRSAQKAREFHTRFPEHPKVEEARRNELELLELAVQFGQAEHLPRVEELLLAQAGDPALDDEERFELRTRLLQLKVRTKQAEGLEIAIAEFEKGARALREEFPDRPEVYYMLAQIASLVEPEKARVIAREIMESDKAPSEVKEATEDLLAKLERIGKPLDITFTSLEGKEIDLQQMKGKVVLIDFWATWCGPCISALPNLQAAYEKLHPEGFEILGISLDRNKTDLQRFLRREKLPWVHHFDEAGKLSQRFEIASIPTMWLVDKKGILRDIDAGKNLVSKAEKLLAE
jgi:thiol-disulfide isomerase/thioredoxin